MQWLVVLLLAGAACARQATCPSPSDGSASKILIDCGLIHAKGHCDAVPLCRLSGTSNATCASRSPCTTDTSTCVCASEFTCKRRLANGEIALLLCQQNNHEKRQESHATDDDDEDSDQGPSDDTAAFLAIAAILYLLLLCIALIYL